MTFKPSIVAFDYETALTDGTASVEYYRHDFRVTTAAFAWLTESGTVKTLYCEGEEQIRNTLQKVAKDGIPTVVHNYQFEYGVTKYRFPGLEGVVSFDTMRLTQVADNGGKQAQWNDGPKNQFDQLDAVERESKSEQSSGLRLQDCTSRWLGLGFHNHKAPAYNWLRENRGVKVGEEGKNLHMLPPDLLRDYNVADAVVTLHLYTTLVTEFVRLGYDWRLDHSLYTASARRIANRKGRGVRVDRERLAAYRETVLDQIRSIEGNFRAAFTADIEAIEADMRDAYVLQLKSERGQADRRRKLAEDPSIVHFNVLSGKHLAKLFVGRLKLTPRFWTEESKKSKAKRTNQPDKPAFEPNPSFKAAHLATYGVGGELLIERRKRLLVLKQCESLLELSAADGRWHIDMKAAGTTTGRFAGGQQ